MLSFTRYADTINPLQRLYVSTAYLRNQVADVYRSKLRDDTQGVEGDEILRRRVEDFVNLMRPSGIMVSTFPIALTPDISDAKYVTRTGYRFTL
jgi:hypothetical protein